MQTVYIGHPYSADIRGNKVKVLRLCKMAKAAGLLPIAPQLYLDQFMDDATEREEVMQMCLRLLDASDIVWFVGELSPGMMQEIEYLERQGRRYVKFSNKQFGFED